MKKKIFIATSTFGVQSDLPIKILKENKFDIYYNTLGKKLLSEQLIDFASDVNGVIAGTEVYTKEVLDELLH